MWCVELLPLLRHFLCHARPRKSETGNKLTPRVAPAPQRDLDELTKHGITKTDINKFKVCTLAMPPSPFVSPCLFSAFHFLPP